MEKPEPIWRFIWVGITEAGWKMAGEPQSCPWHNKRLEWRDSGYYVDCPDCMLAQLTLDSVVARPTRANWIQAQKQVEAQLAEARSMEKSMAATVYSLQGDLEARRRTVARLEAGMAWLEDQVREAP